MPKTIVDLTILPRDLLRFYEGKAQVVIAHSLSGRRIQLPINALRGYITHEGLVGRFEIAYTRENKLLAVRKLKV